MDRFMAIALISHFDRAKRQIICHYKKSAVAGMTIESKKWFDQRIVISRYFGYQCINLFVCYEINCLGHL